MELLKKKYTVFCLLVICVTNVGATGHVTANSSISTSTLAAISSSGESPVSASSAHNANSSNDADADKLVVSFSGLIINQFEEKVLVQVSYLQAGRQECVVLQQLRNAILPQGQGECTLYTITTCVQV
jgi:hypothetical protein